MFDKETHRRGFLGILGTMLGGVGAVAAFSTPAQGRSFRRSYGGYGYGYPRRSRVRYYAPVSRSRFYGGGVYNRGYYGAPVPYAPYGPSYYAPPVPYYPPNPGVFIRLNDAKPARNALDVLSLLET